MESISLEQENYVRMSLLLTGISPRAVRKCFDNEFAPARLDVSLKKEYDKLRDMKRERRINQSQWNLLFPRRPDVPDSKAFDVTLMITLLRNLTSMIPPLYGFDSLPNATETTQSADLARIKYYRNYLVHTDNGKLEDTFFNTAWTDITGAIERIGGPQMKQECDQLKTKYLDQTSHEIMMDIKRSKDEINDLKTSLNSLKRSHSDMEREMKIIKTSQEDPVPPNVRANIKEILKSWKDTDDKMFIDTRATQQVLKCIKENSCVTITGSSGAGKTATLRHVALQMAENEYDVLPVTYPDEIKKFYSRNKKTLFVVDDLCGNFSFDHSEINIWGPVIDHLKTVLETNLTKTIVACRLQVYKDKKFECLSVFKSCVCNILSENMCLLKTEKHSIAKLYLKEKASDISQYHDLYDCFPLLCKLYHDNPKLEVTDFFQNPFSVYETEIDMLLKKGYHAKYCALALCVFFNNNVKEEMLIEEVNEETRTIIEHICEACKLNRGTSRTILLDELDSLTHTFIKKEENVYKTILDKVFDFLAYYFAKKIMHCLIQNADSGVIKERLLLERNDDMEQFITVIPQKYHQMYIQRMSDDLAKGKVQDVFSNINMKVPRFRENFLLHLNSLDISHQIQLAHSFDKDIVKRCNDTNEYYDQLLSGFVPSDRAIASIGNVSSFDSFDSDNDDNDEEKRDEDCFHTFLLQSCSIGDLSYVKWCCNHGVDVNRCTYSGQPPVLTASVQGNTEVVKFLLDSGADFHHCDDKRQSSIMKACEHGHTEIVKLLLDKGADFNQCDEKRQSSVMKACEHGHTEIVKMMLDKGADLNTYDYRSQTSVMKACVNGHTEIVNMLLNRAADCNKCDTYDQSPIQKASELGHTEIVRMLIDRGVDFNKCDIIQNSPLIDACENGHAEIVKILLDRGATYKCVDWSDHSPVMIACTQGHTEIVRMLLDKGEDLNTCDRNGKSLVMKACEKGRTDIVKMLLHRGADCNKCDDKGKSPVMMACEKGHTEIRNLLLDTGVTV